MQSQSQRTSYWRVVNARVSAKVCSDTVIRCRMQKAEHAFTIYMWLAERNDAQVSGDTTSPTEETPSSCTSATTSSAPAMGMTPMAIDGDDLSSTDPTSQGARSASKKTKKDESDDEMIRRELALFQSFKLCYGTWCFSSSSSSSSYCTGSGFKTVH